MRRFYFPVLTLSALLIAWLVYQPGLKGGFLFDDFGSLPSLGENGPVTKWPVFWRYITSGHADPLGRPLSLLSFLVDAHDWPADPLAFKRTNLLIHLLNGLALACLLRNLGRKLLPLDQRLRYEHAACLGAAFWLLHPLMVSTTLYIVQREAMLSSLMTLLGLLLWLHARHCFERGQNRLGTLGIVTGLGLFTALAMLCKANGILLPVLALSLEYTVLKAADRRDGRTSTKLYNRLFLIFGWLPACVVAAYLAHEAWNGFVHGISSVRPWTLGQRLLTEPRVLLDYLRLLWIPRPFTPGVFNDQWVASQTLVRPWTTLPALLAVATLIACGFIYRHRRPALAAAILFYFGGQLLESSTVSLELYFEHRNYLPAMLMFWPLALWLTGAQPKAETSQTLLQPPNRFVRLGMEAALLSGLIWMTYAAANIWGDSRHQAALWAQLNPDSPRAQALAAQIDMAQGHPQLAISRLTPLVNTQPDQVQLSLNLLSAECQAGFVDTTTLHAATFSLQAARDPGSLLTSWFSRLIEPIPHQACPGLAPAQIHQLLDAAQRNPYFSQNPGREQDIAYLKGLLALREAQPDQALALFDKALALQIRPGQALQQAALLGANGYPTLGLKHLDYFQQISQHTEEPAGGMPWLHEWVLRKQGYWAHETLYLRDTLENDARKKSTTQP